MRFEATRLRLCEPICSRGFTLIELMITVAIVVILAGIAWPSYQNYILRANRSAAEQLMLRIQSLQEQYFLDARSYATNIATGAGSLNITAHETFTCAAATCTNARYNVTLALVAGPPPGYIVRATPVAGTIQVADGTLFLHANAAGVYTPGAKARTAGDNRW